MDNHKIKFSADEKRITLDGIDITNCVISYKLQSLGAGYSYVTLELQCKTDFDVSTTSATEN